jgi:hypothetical protein
VVLGSGKNPGIFRDFVLKLNQSLCFSQEDLKLLPSSLDITSTPTPSQNHLKINSRKPATKTEVSSYLRSYKKAHKRARERESYKYILNFLLWMGRFLLNGLPISLIHRHLKAKSGTFVLPRFLLHHTFFIKSSPESPSTFGIRFFGVNFFIFWVYEFEEKISGC